MAEINGAQAVARTLKEEGVEYFWGVHGGHVWALLSAMCSSGMRMIHTRHEQSAGYAADGYARVTGKVGVCFGTAGPGMLNLAPAVSHSYLCQSPVLALLGQHAAAEDGWGPFQEAYGAQVYQSFTKWTRRVTDWNAISSNVQAALRDALAYPPGPVGLELPREVLVEQGEDKQIGYLHKDFRAPLSASAGDPDAVEKAVSLLVNAKRPVVIGGNGLFWSGASEELQTFVETLQIPVHTRRMGRGAVAETHPLAFSGGYRRALLSKADVVLVLGLRMNTLEHFGIPPTYSREATYIQVSESPEDIATTMPTSVAILGSPKLVLRQMVECAKGLAKEAPDRTEWLGVLNTARENFKKSVRAEAEGVRHNKPIHPAFLCQEVIDFLDPSATIIYDSFTCSAFITDRIEAKFAGQVLDSSTQGGVGHSIGMSLGVQLARPGKQVVAFLGDGGLGIAGWDIETAAREKLPVVYVLYNNSSWIGRNFREVVWPDIDPWDMLPDIRYDKAYEVIGCHGEFVTDPEQIRPAIERAFNSGKTAIVNVIPDDKVAHPLLQQRVEFYKSRPKQQ